MTPIDLKTQIYSERDTEMMSEVQAFIDADVYAAELWKDTNVSDGRNVNIYKRILRKMRISEDYKMCQRRGKVVIKKMDMR